jgi:hypothetical protein
MICGCSNCELLWSEAEMCWPPSSSSYSDAKLACICWLPLEDVSELTHS